jgi:hypothetical protein
MGQDICINRYADDRSKEEAVYGGPPLTPGILGEQEIERECLAEPEPKPKPMPRWIEYPKGHLPLLKEMSL